MKDNCGDHNNAKKEEIYVRKGSVDYVRAFYACWEHQKEAYPYAHCPQ